VWRGTGRDGSGGLSTDSGVLAETPYSFKTRFESEKGTNPEELIAARMPDASRWRRFSAARGRLHANRAQYRGCGHLEQTVRDSASAGRR